ncbi:MAG: class I SAM-dependent methyltransferase [Candidatus Riflebacteria bacterium]|nr:class I SAM-dependent methyltransferase [Candidatus Riflebacteria bacterium]
MKPPPAPEAPACPLCGAGTVLATQAGSREFRRCEACELVSVPRHRQPGDEQARARYLRHHNLPDDEGYVDFLRPALEAVRRHAPPGGTVLDLGCGPSPVLAGLLSGAGFRVWAHDPLFGPDLPRALTAAGPPPFDCVVATEVVEHFREPGADLKAALRLLAPGGRLVAMTLLLQPDTDLASWWYARDPTHVAFYSRRTFEFVARRHGLHLLECDGRRLVVLGAGVLGGPSFAGP